MRRTHPISQILFPHPLYHPGQALVLLLTIAPATPLHAQLVCYEGFTAYAAGTQVENGGNGSSGTALDAGAGWGGPYDVSNAIKSLVRIEDRTATPVNYSRGEITISGGNRALRFYDIANGSYALRRPLGTVFSAAAGETLWFSVLFRTSGASPLANADFFQLGFDDSAAVGNPRVSIGAHTVSTTFPAAFRFFARSTAAADASVFYQDLEIAAATTYLLVGSIQPAAGVYATVSLFVDPTTLDDPGPPAATITLPSGLASLSHALIRTVDLDSGDVHVLDEWHIGRDYGSVVRSLRQALRILPASGTGGSPALALRWPVSLHGAVLETSTTLAPESWEEITGPFSTSGADYEYPAPPDPGSTRRFFRLRR